MFVKSKLSEDESSYMGKNPSELTKKELMEYIKKLEGEMKQAAKDLQMQKIC